MIGGIFGVLGQAQQQAEAQRQKNLDAQNEMNRVMMMAGYRPNATDPAATQGGAPPQGIADILGQTYGKSDYEFDPSQYTFDENSPQGQALQNERDKIGLEGDRVAELTRHNKATENIAEQGQLDEWHLNTLKQQNAEKQLSIMDRNQTLKEQGEEWSRYFQSMGLEIEKIKIDTGRYKVFERDGQTFMFDPWKAEQGKEAWTISDPKPTGLPFKIAATMPKVIAALEAAGMTDLDDDKKEEIGKLIVSTMMDGLSGTLDGDEDEIIAKMLSEAGNKSEENVTKEEPDIGGNKEEGTSERENLFNGDIYKDGRWFPGLRDDIFYNFSPDAETQSLQESTGIRPYTPKSTTQDFWDGGGS